MATNCLSKEYAQKFERTKKPLKKELIKVFATHMDQHMSDAEESDEHPGDISDTSESN